MSSFPCIGKRPPWLFFSTLKSLLTKRQPGAQPWHQPSRSPALSKRTQGSISFLHGLQECVPGASWVIQGGFYFTRVEAWGWRGRSVELTFSKLPQCSVLTNIALFHPHNNPGRWTLLSPLYWWGNQAHSGVVTEAVCSHPALEVVRSLGTVRAWERWYTFLLSENHLCGWRISNTYALLYSFTSALSKTFFIGFEIFL